MEPVFIVAQYKSGTSWLLAALSAHPDVRALREIDIIKPTFAPDGSLAATQDRLEGFFERSAWSRPDVGDDLRVGPPTDTRSVADLPGEEVRRLERIVRDATTPEEVLETFLEVTSSGGNASTLVLKAADQIAVFDHLQAWRPEAPKIAIVRDVRDAAISAQHFRELMAKKNAPWLSERTDYFQLLRGMVSRSHMIADRAEAGELFVLRYEDLSQDFHGVFGRLLRRLGLDDDDGLIAEIHARTSFEARTGRPRGTDGEGLLRKGALGEWREALDREDAERAWDIAGDALQRLGYTRNGIIQALPAELRRSG